MTLKEWTPKQIISTESTSDSLKPSISVDKEGNVNIFWNDDTDYLGSGSDSDIFHKSQDIHSQTWSATDVVSIESSDFSYIPQSIMDESGNIHLIWYDDANIESCGTDTDVLYKYWNTSLGTWETIQVVSTESTADSFTPTFDIDEEGNIHVCWYDWTNYGGSGTDADIFYKYWDASSQSWSTTQIVSTESTGHSHHPDIDADEEGNLHVVWYDYTNIDGSGTDADICYKKWNKETETWLTTEVISTESTGDSLEPEIKVSQKGAIHIIWEDLTDLSCGTDKDIFYKKWSPVTEIWTTTVILTKACTSSSYGSAITMDEEGNIYIVWNDNSDLDGSGTDADIFFRYWDIKKGIWSSIEVVTAGVINSNDARYPCIAVDSSHNVYVAWEDSGADIDIFFSQLIGVSPSPELAFINPNPDFTGDIYLDWDVVSSTVHYDVYRSSSYIWSIDSLEPIGSANESYYYDTIIADGYYYYVITATNIIGTSDISNCEYVEVLSKIPAPPELAIITPNPSSDSNIILDWDDVDGAISYFVYRSNSFIWSIEGLTPIATVGSSTHTDSLPSTGYYFYVIVATDGLRNSKISNCEYIHYVLPTLGEIIISSSLAMVILVAILVLRKRNKWKQK